LSLVVNGQPMDVFEHRASSDESLTLGSNVGNSDLKPANMYVVFLKGSQ
jgi:hypothetical protein